MPSYAICDTAFKTLNTCMAPPWSWTLLNCVCCLQPSSYIVMDLLNGGDLRFHISRKTFTEEAVRFWMAELGCALRYIHSQGIIHRDVKPDNVLLDAEGHLHLADFVRTTVIPLQQGANCSCRMWRQSSSRKKNYTANRELWHIWHPKCTEVKDISARWTGGR